MLFFFPRCVLDEILNLIESVSEGFPSYFSITITDLRFVVRVEDKLKLEPQRKSLAKICRRYKMKISADKI